MTKELSMTPPASPAEGGRSPTRAGEAGGAPKRFFATHKTQAVLRLLRGEPIEFVSRDLGLTAATLTAWKDMFLAAGERSFVKKTPEQERETKRLNAKIGEQAMENELLREKIARMEQNRPLPLRRSKR
jgi:hypothetical protein